MAKDSQLDPGFEEIPLDEGFSEVPVNKPIVPSASDNAQRLLEQTKSGLQNVGEGVIDTSKAVAQGGTLGGLSVLGGIEGAAQEALLGPKKIKDYSLDDLKKLYREYQQNVEGNLEQSRERSPVLTPVGEFAGMMVPALATGGSTLAPEALEALGSIGLKQAYKAGGASLAKEVGKRALVGSVEGAPIGAAYSALSSKHNIIGASPEEKQANLNEALHGAITGGGLGAAVSIGSDLMRASGSKASQGLRDSIAKKIEDTPYIRQLSKNIENEFSGQGYFGQAAENTKLSQESKGLEDITNTFLDSKKKLGQNIEKALASADEGGFKVTPGKEDVTSAGNFNNLLEENKNILGIKDKDKFISKLEDYQSGNLGGVDTHELKMDLKNVLDSYRDSGDTKGREIYGYASDLYSSLDNSLESVPGFRQANDQFKGFLAAGPETIINKGLPEGISQTRLYQTNKPKEKIYTGLSKVVRKVGESGTSAETAKKTFNEVIDNLKQYEEQNPGILKRIGFDPEKFQSSIKNLGDEASVRGYRSGYFTPGGSLTEKVIGKGTFGTSGLAANIAGKAARSGPARLSRDVYNASKEELQSFANSLRESPETANQAQALNTAIEQGDMQKKNAILFSLLQSPKVRQKFSSEEGE